MITADYLFVSCFIDQAVITETRVQGRGGTYIYIYIYDYISHV